MNSVDETTALAVDARHLADLLDLSLRTIRSKDAAGKLPRAIRIGSAKRWVLDGPNGIRAWLEKGAPDRRTFESLQKGEKDR